MSAAIVLCGALLIVDSRLRSALTAYVVFTIGVLVLAHPRGPEAGIGDLALFGALAFLKVVVGPTAIVWLHVNRRVPGDLAPSFNLGVRIAVAVLAFSAARYFGASPAFADAKFGAVVFYAIFASICVVLLHRNLLAHMIGLLALGSSITLAAAVFAPALPGGVELADTFDALFATLVAIAVARAIAQHDPRLDIRSLRGLRG